MAGAEIAEIASVRARRCANATASWGPPYDPHSYTATWFVSDEAHYAAARQVGTQQQLLLHCRLSRLECGFDELGALFGDDDGGSSSGDGGGSSSGDGGGGGNLSIGVCVLVGD